MIFFWAIGTFLSEPLHLLREFNEPDLLSPPSPFFSFKAASVTDDNDNSWRDVYRNIKCMDQLYDATFYSWLKSEDNVLVTAVYLHRIANEYPLFRIINALKWLISDWRLESISILVRHVTVDWKDEVGKLPIMM